MFERCTDQSIAIVADSRRHARDLGHDHLGTEHLLLGILSCDSPSVIPSLAQFGVTLAEARAQTCAVVAPPAAGPPAHLELTEAAQRALEWARIESMRRPRSLIAPDDLLLGVIQANGTGVAVLVGLGVDTGGLYHAVRRPSPPPSGLRPRPPGQVSTPPPHPNLFVDMLQVTDEVTQLAIRALIVARRAGIDSDGDPGAEAESELEALVIRLATLLMDMGADELVDRMREIVWMDPVSGEIVLRRR